MTKKAKTAEERGSKIKQIINCPKCEQEMSLVMRMPKRRMWWTCNVCGHEQLKMPVDWK